MRRRATKLGATFEATVDLCCRAPRARLYSRRLLADGRALMGLLGLDGFELSLSLTNDVAIKALNRHFRGRDTATDVLSFPQLDPEAVRGTSRGGGADMPKALGDVVISIDTALRQAVRMRLAPEMRLRALLIHGLLHLLGYDHERSTGAARRMFTRERELTAALRRVSDKPLGRQRRARAAAARLGRSL